MRFTVYGVPVSKGSTRAFIPRGWKRPIITSDNKPEMKSWSRDVAAAALEARRSGGVLEVPVTMTVAFVLPRPKSAPKRVQHPTKKPDVDKLLRAILDALTGILWRDDAQVITVHAEKRYVEGDAVPSAEITVDAVVADRPKG